MKDKFCEYMPIEIWGEEGLKDIDVNNILELTPQEILNWLIHNKKSISYEIKNLKSEVLQMKKELKKVSKDFRRIELKKEIMEREKNINEVNEELNQWVLNRYKDIKNKIRETLKQSIDISDKKLDTMIDVMEEMLNRKEYMQTPIQKIVDIILEKENSYYNSNLPIKIEDEVKKREYKDICKYRQGELYSLEEPLIPTEVLRKLPEKSSNNNIKISMFYASIDGGKERGNLNDKSLEVGLLKILDLASRFLYGALQNQITELYKEIQNKESNM